MDLYYMVDRATLDVLAENRSLEDLRALARRRYGGTPRFNHVHRSGGYVVVSSGRAVADVVPEAEDKKEGAP